MTNNFPVAAQQRELLSWCEALSSFFCRLLRNYCHALNILSAGEKMSDGFFRSRRDFHNGNFLIISTNFFNYHMDGKLCLQLNFMHEN